MKRFLGITLMLIVMLSMSVSAMKWKNNRFVPDKLDWADQGAGPRYNFLCSLLVEVTNILPSTVTSSTWRACSLSKCWADTLVTLTADFSGVVTLDTLKYPDRNTRPQYGLCKTSKVTIGHPGATNTNLAWTSAENTTEQSLVVDTIPAWARIVDVTLITTEAITGITTSFSCDGGDGAGTDEFFAATDMKAADAVIGGDASEAILLQPLSTVTKIYVNGTPAAENWSAMTAGEWVLLTTYIDLGSIK